MQNFYLLQNYAQCSCITFSIMLISHLKKVPVTDKCVKYFYASIQPFYRSILYQYTYTSRLRSGTYLYMYYIYTFLLKVKKIILMCNLIFNPFPTMTLSFLRFKYKLQLCNITFYLIKKWLCNLWIPGICKGGWTINKLPIRSTYKILIL